MLFLAAALLFFFKQKTAYELRISDWSSDVCSSDLPQHYLGGIALRLLAMISLSLMFVLVKKIDAADIHIVESLFWRQALVLPFLLAWVMATSGLSSLKTRRIGAHARDRKSVV